MANSIKSYDPIKNVIKKELKDFLNFWWLRLQKSAAKPTKSWHSFITLTYTHV